MITVEDLHKAFGPKEVLRGVSLEIEPGETLAIIGKSGTGKSVLLKLIVGLLEPDMGYVEFDGKRVEDLELDELYEMRRSIGYVFQGAALFDSMTVGENLSLELEEHREADPETLENEIQKNLANVGLLPSRSSLSEDEYEQAFRILVNKMPSELSGGMKKRVGVARALIGNPNYIFYDEPTTGLDPITSEQIDNLIMDLTKKLDVTSVLITHDIFSVYKVAHRVIMLDHGLIRFVGTPRELRQSGDPIVQEFLERYRAGIDVG